MQSLPFFRLEGILSMRKICQPMQSISSNQLSAICYSKGLLVQGAPINAWHSIKYGVECWSGVLEWSLESDLGVDFGVDFWSEILE